MKLVCIICTDVIKEGFAAAPCGHTFHYKCLTEWLSHQKSCPQCREKCLLRNVLKLFVDSSESLTQVDSQSLDPDQLREKLRLQEEVLTNKDQALKEARKSLNDIKEEMEAWQLQHKETHKKLKHERSVNEVLKRELKYVQEEVDQGKTLKQEQEQLKKRVETLEGVEKMLKGSREEADELVSSHKSNATLAVFAVALKRDYEALKEKLSRERDKHAEEVYRMRKQLQNKEKELHSCKQQLSVFESDLLRTEEEKTALREKVKTLHAAVESPGSRYALKRMLESPMPDCVASNIADLGSSPALTKPPPKLPRTVSDSDLMEPTVSSAPAPGSSSRENIIMPNSLTLKGRPLAKSLSSHVMKKGLKFAPRKNSHPLMSRTNNQK